MASCFKGAVTVRFSSRSDTTSGDTIPPMSRDCITGAEQNRREGDTT
jgi:hypothetical protein